MRRVLVVRLALDARRNALVALERLQESALPDRPKPPGIGREGR
jgi:hypothetical protein